MREDEINDQRNRYGRLVTFSDQFYIAPLNYEIRAFESMWRILIKKGRGVRGRGRRVMQKIATFEPSCTLDWKRLGHNQILNRRKTNPVIQTSLVYPTQICGETWEDVLACFEKNSNGIKSMKLAAGSRQSDVAQQSLDPVGQQVVREQVVTEQVSTKSVVFVTLRIFCRIYFSQLCTRYNRSLHYYNRSTSLSHS